MSEIYLISDQHYKHQEICQYTERPFKLVKEMNKTMIDRHNSFVSPEDIVYHLGDFCFTSGWQIGRAHV